MSNIAVLGERDSIYGFAALGLDVFPVSDKQQAHKKIKNLISRNYSIIYITESIVVELEEEIEKYNEDSMVAIIPIPGIMGNSGIGMKNIKKSTIKAIGSDIIFDKEGTN